MTKFKCVWLEFPRGNRSYGGGGWSARAKSRPAPERFEIITEDVVFTSGQSVIVAGRRKVKLNVFKAATGEVVRNDYPLKGLTRFGLSTRQMGARQAAGTRKVKKKISANAHITIQAIEQMLATPTRLLLPPPPLPQDIQGWLAAGCFHPAPADVYAAKAASGLGWKQFINSLQGGAL